MGTGSDFSYSLPSSVYYSLRSPTSVQP